MERLRGLFAVPIVGIAMLALLAGCGSSSNDSSSDASASGDGGAAIENAKAAAAKAEEPKSAADSKMPDASPPAKQGVKLAAVTCGVAVEGCRIASEAHIEAAKAMGWDTELIDGKGTPKGWNDGIVAALQTNPDVLALGAILPSAVGDALAQAEKDGVTVICSVCGVTEGDQSVQVATGDDFNAPLGDAVGNYILAQGGEDVNALMLIYPEFAVSKLRHDAAKKVLDTCESCTSETLEVKISEWGTTLPERLQGVLQQNPDINWIFSPGDATALDSINAITAIGKDQDIKIAGGNGEEQSFQAVRDGGPYVAIGAVPYQLAGWQAVDGANRILNGDDPVPAASPVRLVTQSNIDEIPVGEYYGADFDFRAEYEKLWGVN